MYDNVNNVSKILKKKERKDLNKRVMLDDITDLKHVTVIFFQGVCVKCSFRSASLAWSGETKQNKRNKRINGKFKASKNILESRLQPPLLGVDDAMKGCSSSVLPTGRPTGPAGSVFFLCLVVVVVVVV